MREQRLGVAQLAGAGGGIAHVADGGLAGELFAEHPRREDLADQAHAGVAVEGVAVGDDDAGRLLAAVLLGEEALVADLRRVLGPQMPNRPHFSFFSYS